MPRAPAFPISGSRRAVCTRSPSVPPDCGFSVSAVPAAVFRSVCPPLSGYWQSPGSRLQTALRTVPLSAYRDIPAAARRYRKYRSHKDSVREWLFRDLLLRIRRAPVLKFLIELFSKSSRSPEAEPLVAIRRSRNSPAFKSLAGLGTCDRSPHSIIASAQRIPLFL